MRGKTRETPKSSGASVCRREQWKDARLAYASFNDTYYKPPSITVPSLVNRIWRADTFFPVCSYLQPLKKTFCAYCRTKKMRT